MKIHLMFIFVINCLPSTTFYQKDVFPERNPVVSQLLAKSPYFPIGKVQKFQDFENFWLGGLHIVEEMWPRK